MKTLLLHLLAFCALVAPLSMAEARSPGPPVIIGGFQVGKTFTLPVIFMASYATVVGGDPQPATPPKGIPAFALGQQLKFTIGKKGVLIGPGFKIPFHSGSADSNTYIGMPSRKSPNPPAAIVFKNSSGEPIGIGLQFVRVKTAGRIPTTYSVNYGVGAIPE